MLKRLLLAAAFALSAFGAAAEPRMDRVFADSQVVVRERFSDEVIGKGPDLVFIPGLGSSRAVWKATAERLRGRYRIHLIQFAGFAGEPPGANAAGEVIAPSLEAIDAYLVDQKLTPATVIGHSMGGTAALYLATRHPEHMRKAMVVDALPFMGGVWGDVNATPDSVRPMATQLRDSMIHGGAGYADGLKAGLTGMVTRTEDRQMIMGWGAASDPSVVARAIYENVTIDLRPGLGRLRAPVAVLYADTPNVEMPPGVMDRIYQVQYAGIAQVKTQRVARSRHFIMLDQPEAFARALDAFLADQP
jgi:pimeloyl-ACP methyl ester carboxylesterase